MYTSWSGTLQDENGSLKILLRRSVFRRCHYRSPAPPPPPSLSLFFLVSRHFRRGTCAPRGGAVFVALLKVSEALDSPCNGDPVSLKRAGGRHRANVRLSRRRAIRAACLAWQVRSSLPPGNGFPMSQDPTRSRPPLTSTTRLRPDVR